LCAEYSLDSSFRQGSEGGFCDAVPRHALAARLPRIRDFLERYFIIHEFGQRLRPGPWVIRR